MQDYELTRIVQHAILDGHKPAKLVSQEIGKPYSTMLREANPYDTSAKVGIETLLDIMRVTGSSAPLHYMAKALGYELIPAAKPKSEGYNAHATISA